MKRVLAAIIGIALSVGPAFAQLQTDGQINLSNEWSMRSPAHFYKRVTMSMGRGLPSGNPQQMQAIGMIYQLPLQQSSSTTLAKTVGQTLVPYTFLAGFPRVLHAKVYGRTAANGNTKVVQFIFGTQTVTLLNAASNAKDFYADIDIYATGTNTQQINVAGYANGSLLDGLSVAGTQTTTGNLDVKVNIPTTTGAADVVLTGLDIYGEG